MTVRLERTECSAIDSVCGYYFEIMPREVEAGEEVAEAAGAANALSCANGIGPGVFGEGEDVWEEVGRPEGVVVAEDYYACGDRLRISGL